MQLVYVDFDGTLVGTNSFQYLYFVKWRRCLETRRLRDIAALVLCVLALPLLVGAHLVSAVWRDRLTYAFYRGYNSAELLRLMKLYWRKRRPYARTVEFLQRKRAEGAVIVIVSGSIYEVVQSAVEAWGLTAVVDDVLTARLQYRRAKATGRLAGTPMVEGHKVTAILAHEVAHGRAAPARICISDSYSDRPMLELAARKIVVKPRTKLQSIARADAWEIWETA